MDWVFRLRYWFFDRFGERTVVKCYLGHGNFDELNGWSFRGKFFPCCLKEEKEFYARIKHAI